MSDIRKRGEAGWLKGKRSRSTDLSDIHIPRSDRGVKIFAAIVAAVIVILAAFVGYLLVLRNEATVSADTLFGGLNDMVHNPFGSHVQQGIGQGDSQSQYGMNLLKALPLLKDIPTGFVDMERLSGLMIETEVYVARLGISGLPSFFNGGGSTLLSELNDIDSNLKNINVLGSSIRNIAAEFNAIAPNVASDYFFTGTDLQRDTDALDSLISLLSQKDSHILLLFENTDVERPGGGKIMAYADVAISDGSLISISVKNIDTLQQYDQKFVPPLQLQTVETTWKLRDSDWFFNFPTSASEIVSRIENADAAQGSPEQYSGVVAVSSRVIQDLIDTLGPVQLTDKRSVTAVNLQQQINQSGWTQFLNQFIPSLINRVGNLSDDEKSNLSTDASQWIANRDIRFYFTDSKLENFVSQYDLGGETYALNSGFVGDYLAVVHTDIGSGNREPDSLSLHSNIQLDGTIQNDLSITRQNQNTYINQEYFQVMVPSGSKLVSVIGSTRDNISPAADYKLPGYVEDPNVSSVEATRQVDPNTLAETYNIPGHTIFGFWLTLLPGSTDNVSVTYDSPPIPLTDGENYQFVIERQPGERASIIYSVQTPQGWQWQQAADTIWLYSSNSLPGRTILNLNLIKNGS